MNRYTKIINMMDSYYTKDYEKTKKNITKVREVREETVRRLRSFSCIRRNRKRNTYR